MKSQTSKNYLKIGCVLIEDMSVAYALYLETALTKNALMQSMSEFRTWSSAMDWLESVKRMHNHCAELLNRQGLCYHGPITKTDILNFKGNET